MTLHSITAGEFTTLRKSGHSSQLYLAFLVPASVYTARLAALPSSNDMVASITYTSGVGTLANVKVGMTLYVGSTAGAFDLGMAYIRKDPISGTFYISEQSKIIWTANCYLTVVRDFDLWAKHIHMSGTTIQMDYDIAYSDQHTSFNPVPVLGVHRVAKLTGVTVVVQLGPDTGEASWVYGSTISTYLWSVPTAVSVSNTAIAKPTATFNSVGWHACYCTVTAANGKSKTGVRWVYIWNDANLPTTVFQLKGWSEDYESGGVGCRVVLSDQANLTEIRERSLCILFSADRYGPYDASTETSVGQVTGCEHIRFIGRVGDEGIEYDYDQGTVTLELYNNRYWFNKIETFPTGVEIAKNTPSKWTDMPALTVDRGIWHLLEWRSTATAIMDITLSGDTRYSPEVSSGSGNLWAQMYSFAFSQIMARVQVDAFNRMFVSIDPQIVPASSRTTIVEVATLTKVDFLSGVSIDKQIVPETSMIDVSGVGIDAFGAGSAFFALSPGHVYDQYGSSEVIDKLLVASQAGLNQLAGLIFGWRINKYKEINITLAGNNNMISCFPRQYIVFTVESSDSPREEAISMRWIPRSRSVDYDNETGAWEYKLSIEAETFEQNSVAYVPPSGDDISIPPLPPLPPLPDFTPITPDDTGTGGPAVVLLIDDNYGIIRTDNFNDVSPTWQFWNTGIDSGDLPYILGAGSDGGKESQVFTTPSGGVYIAVYEHQYTRWYDRLYYAPAIGGTFTKVIDQTWLNAICGPGDRNGKIFAVGYNPLKSNEVAMIIGDDYTKRFMLGSVGTYVQKSTFGANTNFSGNITFGGNQWAFDLRYAADAYWVRFSASGSYVGVSTPGLGQGAYNHVRQGTSATTFVVHGGVFPTANKGLWYSNDNGATFAQITPGPINGLFGNLAVSSDGANMMSGYDYFGARRGRSTDGGYTWDGSFFTYGNWFCYAYAGGLGSSSKWILGRAYVRYSDDAGANWVAKEGNLAFILPIGMNIGRILVPSMLFPS